MGLRLGSDFCWMSPAERSGLAGGSLDKHFGHMKSFFFLAFSLASLVERPEQASCWWQDLPHRLQVSQLEMSFFLHAGARQVGLGD